MMRTKYSALCLISTGVLTIASFACSGGDGHTSGASNGNSEQGDTEESSDHGDGGATTGGDDGDDETTADGDGGTAGDGDGEGEGNGDGDGDGDGDGGPPGEEPLRMCEEECSTDTDCSEGFDCVDSRCVSTAPPECTSDGICIANASSWMSSCDAQEDCLVPGTSCVDIGDGEGRCAQEPSGAAPCSSLALEEMEMPLIEGDGDVTVCGDARAHCKTGECGQSCVPGSCTEHFECNEETGDCECANDRACDGVANASICVDGQCQCADDGDCTENANRCVDGACGCSDGSVCREDELHPGTSWVCIAQ